MVLIASKVERQLECIMHQLCINNLIALQKSIMPKAYMMTSAQKIVFLVFYSILDVFILKLG